MRKKIVPPREERQAAIGDPKTPKMGKLSPKNIEVPNVEELLGEIKKALPAPARMPFQYISFDLGTEPYQDGRCNHGCGCGPCRRGNCGNCTVDAQRNSDRDTVRSYVARYRGIDLPPRVKS